MVGKEQKKRASVDFTEENYKTIRDFSEKANSTYGRVVNYLIDVFLKLTPEIRSELATFCSERMKKLMIEQMECGGEFERQAIEKKITKYRELAYFFGIGEAKKEEPSNMRKMFMKDGFICFPADWTVVNESEALEHTEAIVCEPAMKNDEIGHYLIFSDKAPDAMTADEKDQVIECIAEVDIEFKKAWNDASAKRIMSYAGRLMNLYAVYVREEANDDATPPYGCMITRNQAAN